MGEKVNQRNIRNQEKQKEGAKSLRDTPKNTTITNFLKFCCKLDNLQCVHFHIIIDTSIVGVSYFLISAYLSIL